MAWQPKFNRQSRPSIDDYVGTSRVSSYGPQDLHTVALAILGEAGNQSDKGKLAVAHVIANRANLMGVSASEAARQSGSGKYAQFSFLNSPDNIKSLEGQAKKNTPAYQKAVDLANQVLSGQSIDPTQGALYYNADYNTPSWRNDGFTPTVKIGVHEFFGGPQAEAELLSMAPALQANIKPELSIPDDSPVYAAITPGTTQLADRSNQYPPAEDIGINASPDATDGIQQALASLGMDPGLPQIAQAEANQPQPQFASANTDVFSNIFGGQLRPTLQPPSPTPPTAYPSVDESNRRMEDYRESERAKAYSALPARPNPTVSAPPAAPPGQRQNAVSQASPSDKSIPLMQAKVGELATRYIAEHPETAQQVTRQMNEAGYNVDGSPLAGGPIQKTIRDPEFAAISEAMGSQDEAAMEANRAAALSALPAQWNDLGGMATAGAPAPDPTASAGAQRPIPMAIDGTMLGGGGQSLSASSTASPIPTPAQITGSAYGSSSPDPSATESVGRILQSFFPGKAQDDRVMPTPISPSATTAAPDPTISASADVQTPMQRILGGISGGFGVSPAAASEASPSFSEPMDLGGSASANPSAPDPFAQASVRPTGPWSIPSFPGKEKDDLGVGLSPAVSITPRPVPTVSVSTPPDPVDHTLEAGRPSIFSTMTGTGTHLGKLEDDLGIGLPSTPVPTATAAPAPAPRPTYAAPAAPPKTVQRVQKPAVPVPDDTSGWGALGTKLQQAAQAGVDAVKQGAMKTWLGGGPVTRATMGINGVPAAIGSAGFWNNLDTSSPTATAQASFAAGNQARAKSGLYTVAQALQMLSSQPGGSYANRYSSALSPGSGGYNRGTALTDRTSNQ